MASPQGQERKQGKRTPQGRFVPGSSGNPGGRPKIAHKIGRLIELAREHTTTALEVLVQVATNPKASPSARVAAASYILDRGWGRPVQAVQWEGELPAAIKIDWLAPTDATTNGHQAADEATPV